MTLVNQAILGKKTLGEIEALLQNRLEYFTSPKFNAPDDYVRTWEVIEMIRHIRGIIGETKHELTVEISGNSLTST